MKAKNVAKVYARAFLDLSSELKFNIADELTKLTEVINSSNDLENVLFLDVFSPDEKKDIFTQIAVKLKLNDALTNGINFLIDSKRMNLLPLIFKEIIIIDDHLKGFLRGTIEGADEELPKEIKLQLEKYIQEKLGKKPILKYSQSQKVSAGYRVTVEDMQLDASVDNQLERFKESFISE